MNTPRPGTSGQMTINLPNVIKTLGESLYSDPSVSIRELIQNANDACIVRLADDRKVQPGEIHMRVDTWKRTLIIEDNGAGMTEQEVKEFLTVIGSSKTDEVRKRLEEMGQGILAERLIGRFGLGLLSAFIIGDRIEFETLSYKEGAPAIWWQCDGGQEYKMGLAKGKNTVGTRITVNVSLKHIGMLSSERLTALIHTYADLLEVPIYLDPSRNPINAMNAPWHRQATDAEYRQFLVNRYPNDAILDIIRIEIEEDGGKFKVGGALFVPKQPLVIIKEHGDVIVYVRRMFVCKDERTLLPDWAKFVKGVIESPNLRETASREAIQHDENFQRVQKVVGEAILNYLTRVSNEDPRLFKEIVTNHNLVIKAWAIVSDELFERIKDIVLFNTDAGLVNLQRYFEISRYSSRTTPNTNENKRYIFYYTTSGGEGQYTVLFAAKGLRVIDAQYFPDETFLEKYADKHDDIVLKQLNIGGEFIFEELETRERKWVDLEEEYSRMSIDAKVVRFVPEDIPAVLIFPETVPVTDQIDKLLNDRDLSPHLKKLVSQMWEDREKQRKRRISGGSILHVNANNQVMQKLVDEDLHDNEIVQIMNAIYNNAVMLSTQSARTSLTAENAKRVFEGNTRTIAVLMTKIYEVRDLKARQVVESGKRVTPVVQTSTAEPIAQLPVDPAIEQTKHITCFIALPFKGEYDPLLEALRDVLEDTPYFWQVVRADKQYFANTVPENVGRWIARAQCFAVELSEGNENVMMELGQMYWGYPQRPLILLQRQGTQKRLADLGERIRILYSWDDPPDRQRISAQLRKEIEKFDELKNLRGEAHYLSTRILKLDWLNPEVAQEIARHYKTVEDFVGRDSALISQELGTNTAPKGLVTEIQVHLRTVCKLPS